MIIDKYYPWTVVRSNPNGFLLSSVMETAVAEPTVEAPVAPPKDKPEEKEDIDDIEKRARKPPADGLCTRCNLAKPINRIKLCYRCWCAFENEKLGWREGLPHPASCGCSLDCRFDQKAGDN